MPFSPSDAPSHTLKASTPKLRALWAETANSVLKETGDDARAIREANAVVARTATTIIRRKI